MFKGILIEIRDFLKVMADCLQKQSAIALPISEVSSCKYTLYSWLEEWYNTYKKPTVKPATLETLDVAIRVHIKPNLADMPLNLLNGLELQKFLMSINKSRTRKSVYDVLNMALKEACDLKLISDNPMVGVKIPVHRRTKGDALTSEELEKFLFAIKGHPTETYFKILLYTGCRRNEALYIKKSDVDFEKKLLHIRGTKTETSNRTIPLFEKVAALLVKTKCLKDGFYFHFRPDYLTHIFKKFSPNHKLHDLRHTFASNCLDAQIPLKVVQNWLGHSNIDTTADIYAQVSKELNMQEADKLNKFFATNKKQKPPFRTV